MTSITSGSTLVVALWSKYRIQWEFNPYHALSQLYRTTSIRMGKMRFEILGDTGEMESDILEQKTHVKGCLDFLIHPDSGRKLLLPYIQLDMPNHTKQAHRQNTGSSIRTATPTG